MADKKTPSARVVAAMLILKLLDEAPAYDSERLTSMVDSRISPEKRSKVLEFKKKLSLKFEERMQKIVDRYENPPPSKNKGTKPSFGRKD